MFHRACTYVGAILLAISSIAIAHAEDSFIGYLTSDGTIITVFRYRNGKWSDVTKESLPKQWYLIGKGREQKPIQVTEIVRDINRDYGWEIRTEVWEMAAGLRADYGEAKPTGWVANSIGDVGWSPLQSYATPRRRGEDKEIPASMKPLAAEIQSKWAALDWPVVAAVVPKDLQAELKKEWRAAAFYNFSIDRGTWRPSNVALLFFQAQKHASVLTPQGMGNRAGGVLSYRAWAVVWPDRRIQWYQTRVAVSERSDLNASVWEDVQPQALAEFHGRKYLLTTVVQYQNQGACSHQEVFELEEGHFKSRGTFEHDCNGD
jgi:hypothetical protein